MAGAAVEVIESETELRRHRPMTDRQRASAERLLHRHRQRTRPHRHADCRVCAGLSAIVEGHFLASQWNNPMTTTSWRPPTATDDELDRRREANVANDARVARARARAAASAWPDDHLDLPTRADRPSKET